MLSTARRLFGAALILVAAMVLTGCDNTARYSVKSYSLGNQLNEFKAHTLTADADGAKFTLVEGGRSALVNGTYAMRRTDITAASTSPLIYHAALYSGGKAVDTFDCSNVTYTRDRVSLQINQTERAIFSGTYVVHHIGANVEGKPDSAKYEVKLVNDGTTIGTWYADAYTTGQSGGVSLTINGIANALIIGGQYTIVQIR